MAENVDGDRRLPIKVVIPQEQDLTSKSPGGGRNKFLDISDKEQAVFVEQVQAVREYFSDALSGSNIPAVARVVLKEDALAKTYRPQSIFSRDTCPVFGGETIGSLLVSVRPAGLNRLEEAIRRKPTNAIAQDLATISRIEPYTGEDAIGLWGISEFSEHIRTEKLEKVKVRLFRHRDPALNNQIYQSFLAMANDLGLSAPEQLSYSTDVTVYRLRGVANEEQVARLANFVGTQSLSPFPQFALFAQYIPQGVASVASFPLPSPEIDYPLVGVIDSGTDPSNEVLRPWIAIRDEEDVPAADQDNNHGSFVAGLIANGRSLNHGDQRFPSAQSKIIDVVALPKEGTRIDEDDLVQTIRRAVSKYPQAKVWNLSISKVNALCEDDIFSDLAVVIDSVQEEFDVTFCICAGNYSSLPLRGWNPPENLGEDDRVHPPADSIHAVTVGV